VLLVCCCHRDQQCRRVEQPGFLELEFQRAYQRELQLVLLVVSSRQKLVLPLQQMPGLVPVLVFRIEAPLWQQQPSLKGEQVAS
jgi:hypothetical protein